MTRPIPLTALVLLGMIGALGGALFFEHALGYVPCQLCLQQREPYYLGIPFAVAGLVALALAAPAALWRGLLAIVGACLLATLALGVYHAGAEWNFWAGPADCGAAANALPSSADGLLGSLSNTRPPSCTEAAGRFLGLSFAGWNVVAATILAALAFKAATADTLRSSTVATN